MEERGSYTSKKREIIYIPLLNEGTVVWRPTFGLRLEEDVYEVLPTQNYNPDDEEWEFPPGTIVKCEKELREGKEVLIAKERASRRP